MKGCRATRGVGRARGLQAIAALLALGALAAPMPARPVEVYSESAVKAAFVLRFAGYVEWTSDALPAGELRIAVLGDPAVAASLETLAAGRILSGRAVQVRAVRSVAQAMDAQVLVIGTARRGGLASLLRPLAGQEMLIVTAEDDALAAGSVINFLKDGSRMRFEISLPAARRMGLRVSSELLSVAVRVQQ